MNGDALPLDPEPISWADIQASKRHCRQLDELDEMLAQISEALAQPLNIAELRP